MDDHFPLFTRHPKSRQRGYKPRLWARFETRKRHNNTLFRARSRLYRRQILQVNTRWKALDEIYTMHSFAPFFKLKISAKNRNHFFRD